VKGWQKIYKTCGNQKQERIAILISDKADFIQKSEEIKKRSLSINKGNNPIRRYNNSKYICTGHWSPQLDKMNTFEL
jgi:hypothetical protein